MTCPICDEYEPSRPCDECTFLLTEHYVETLVENSEWRVARLLRQLWFAAEHVNFDDLRGGQERLARDRIESAFWRLIPEIRRVEIDAKTESLFTESDVKVDIEVEAANVCVRVELKFKALPQEVHRGVGQSVAYGFAPRNKKPCDASLLLIVCEPGRGRPISMLIQTSTRSHWVLALPVTGCLSAPPLPIG